MQVIEPEIKALAASMANAAARIGRPVAFMEVCGTHTMSAFRCGFRSLLPPNVRLISGPGCPVCVTAQGEIDAMIELAQRPGVTFCTYGDMLRVPGRRGSLEAARGRGADVRIIYSTLDAVRLAAAQRDRPVVFGAVGFETTAPATAAAILQARALGLENFSVYASHKRVIPAMLALLAGGVVRLDGFLCPGHVSVIIGADAYRPIVEHFRLPCVVAGFEDVQILAAVADLLNMVSNGRPALVNQYTQAVSGVGNVTAQELLAQVFQPADAIWRGLGMIPDSGMALRPEFAGFDAVRQFGLAVADSPEPRGCRCGEVITGVITPEQCSLFGGKCTPVNPIGPCMVSSEGTCQAWFKHALRQRPVGKAARRVALKPLATGGRNQGGK